MPNHTPYQQKIIKRYYGNRDTLAIQRLGELVTDLYLAEGKKRDRLWQTAAASMIKAGVPQSRLDHILEKRDAELLARLVKELQAKPA